MSIWCSWEDVGYDSFALIAATDPPIEMVSIGDEPEQRGEVRSYATGFSNHYPTRDGEYEQPASVSIAHIPVWCVPGHRGETDDETVGEWLRLDVLTAEHDYGTAKATGKRESAEVVMDETAVRELAADLAAWLDRPKAHPIPEPSSAGAVDLGVGG